jgi:hypothetical protein
MYLLQFKLLVAWTLTTVTSVLQQSLTDLFLLSAGEGDLVICPAVLGIIEVWKQARMSIKAAANMSCHEGPIKDNLRNQRLLSIDRSVKQTYITAIFSAQQQAVCALLNTLLPMLSPEPTKH